MYAKYAILKKATRIIHFQKIMAQPYSKLQETFKTTSAVPKIPAPQDPNLTFEMQMLCSQPVLYVNHKQLVQKVCIYVVGDDLGDVGSGFEDLRIRKEMIGRADGIFPDGYQSIQHGFRF